ncbi:MAG: hypothetical protein IPH68_02545 [Chitinophagaceae bacterium]|nr:hypothetical protein [Chitinophagaceae bacterium]MBK7559315.1 hypothetical protein [Chitinophagaceae bacterium]MBK9532094.1 hypothetical protein [Chitinophagaceae bacterium]HQW91942.1 hypothetical protein [Ferruginibacter sp.]
MKYVLIAIMFFSAVSNAQKISTISGNGKKLVVADMSFMDRITWGGYEQIGKAAQSETDGVANTRAIVAAVGNNSGYDGKLYAAKVCDTLTLGGYTDWYLPCKDETDIIHLNFEQLKLDEKMTIWSSTEANGTQAVTKYFYSGAFYNVQKVDLCHLVCVRKGD